MIPTKLLTALLLGGGLTAGVSSGPAPARLEGFSYRAFGRSVAISGEYAFVGEPNVVAGFGGRGGGRGGAPPAPGIVHVYRLTAGAWKQVDTLTSVGAAESDGFGSALAAEGNTLLVGQVRPAPVAAPTGGRGG